MDSRQRMDLVASTIRHAQSRCKIPEIMLITLVSRVAACVTETMMD